MKPKLLFVYTTVNGVQTVRAVVEPRPPRQLPLFTLPPPPTPKTWSIEWRWSTETVKQFPERSPEWNVFSSYSTVAQARNTLGRLRRHKADERKNFRLRQTAVHHHGDIECHIPDYPCPVARTLDGSPLYGWAKPTLVPFVMPVASPFPPTPSANQTQPPSPVKFTHEEVVKLKKAMGMPSSPVSPENQSIPWGTSTPPEGWQSPTPWLAQPDQWENPAIKPSVGLPPVVISAGGDTQTWTYAGAYPAPAAAAFSPVMLPPLTVPVDDFVAQFAKAFTAGFSVAIAKTKDDTAAPAACDAAFNNVEEDEKSEGALADDMDW